MLTSALQKIPQIFPNEQLKFLRGHYMLLKRNIPKISTSSPLTSSEVFVVNEREQKLTNLGFLHLSILKCRPNLSDPKSKFRIAVFKWLLLGATPLGTPVACAKVNLFKTAI